MMTKVDTPASPWLEAVSLDAMYLTNYSCTVLSVELAT